MFLKEKRTGEVNWRGCADGRPQWDYVTKEENSAPTVSIEALLLSCTINAMEERDIEIVDIPGDYMHADRKDSGSGGSVCRKPCSTESDCINQGNALFEI